MQDKVLWANVLTMLGKVGHYLELITKILGTGLLWVVFMVIIQNRIDSMILEAIVIYFLVGLVIHGLKYLWVKSWGIA